MFSEASTKRVVEVCMEKRWHWFWTLPQEVEGEGTGGEGTAGLFRDLARGYELGRVATSSRAAYEGRWRMWVKWKTIVGESPCGERRGRSGKRAYRIYGILRGSVGESVVDDKREAGGGELLPPAYPGYVTALSGAFVRGVGEGIKRNNVEKGTQQRVRRP